MKNVRYILVSIVLAVGLTSCEDFLTRYPEGGVLLEDQYEKLPDNLTGSIMGIYSQLYAYGGDHDEFGIRSIDMYGDFQSGDMAMKNETYGWFSNYDRGFFYVYARSYLWGFYYSIINSINISANAVKDNVQEMIDGIGGEPTAATIEQAYYYGQIMALRGWAYANLLNFYCDPMDEIDDFEAEPAVPVYTETEYASGSVGEPRASVAQVYDRVYEDLSMAIDLLDYYGTLYPRSSKLEVDADVARLMLAYAMLNHGKKEMIIADGKNAYQIALERAKEVIDGGYYPLMPVTNLYNTGFANVDAANWMWGQDVTVETTSALASFFGQVDVHTYSYAAAGDTKCIDSKLYDQLAATKWDARVDWFNPGDAKNAYCPENKFYCPSTRNEYDLDKVDRAWLSDNVFMRVEAAYLIAAEAAYRLDDEATSKAYLKALCDERVISGKESEYDAWLSSLAGDELKNAIVYNWRVEMWGEGYGLQTFRRIGKSYDLGTNHLDTRKEKTIEPDESCQCEIPTSEAIYNPNLNKYDYAYDN